MATTTLAEGRQKLAQALGGGYGRFTASGGSTTTVVCANAFQSSVLPTTNQAYAWVFVPGLTYPRQRRVTLAGLNSANGTLTLDGALGAAVSNGSVFEIHTRLPAIREGVADQALATVPGIHEILNLACRHLLTDDDTGVTLSLVNGQRDYSLSTWPWLDRSERLVDVRVLNATGGEYVSTRHTWEFRESARGPTLHFRDPFRFASGSYTARLVVRRPADTLIKVGGSWGDSSVGLVSESDACGPDVNQLETVGLAFAYRALRDARSGADRKRYHDLYTAQVQLARTVRDYDASNEIDQSVPTMSTDGVVPAGSAA